MGIFEINCTGQHNEDPDYLHKNNLSLRAKGLLHLIFDLDTIQAWDYTLDNLCLNCQEEKSLIQEALHELIQRGYIVRKLLLSRESKIINIEYKVFNEPPKELEDGEAVFDISEELEGISF